jgi:hypothetical protein
LSEGVEFAAQEPQHVGRGQVHAGVADQIRPHLQQRRAGREHDVGGDLGLVEHPVVAPEPGGGDLGQQRVDSAGERVDDTRPGPVRQLVAQLAGQLKVLDGKIRGEATRGGRVSNPAPEAAGPVSPGAAGVRPLVPERGAVRGATARSATTRPARTYLPSAARGRRRPGPRVLLIRSLTRCQSSWSTSAGHDGSSETTHSSGTCQCVIASWQLPPPPPSEAQVRPTSSEWDVLLGGVFCRISFPSLDEIAGGEPPPGLY